MLYVKRIILTFALLFLGFTAFAQFSQNGEDPGYVRWNKLETNNFKIIHPKGLDSLSMRYGLELEKARTQISWSEGMIIGQAYKGKMPVVLHPYYAVSNASVTWAPKRMEIYTLPDAFAPTPMPWIKNLALHEGRHATQMQFGALGIFRPFHYVFGEMVAGALAGVYPGLPFMEGDAVVAETGLSNSGRGRQAYFLNYLMPAFDCGDYRNYWKWVYGSQNKFAPDHYRTGYMLIAGTRVFFDDPLFTQKYFSRATHWLRFYNLQKTTYRSTGMTLRKTYASIQKGFQEIWDNEADLRAPFMPSTQITRKPRRHTVYNYGSLAGEQGIVAVKSGLTETNNLVSINGNGTETRLRSFASYTSDVTFDEDGNKLFWTETVPAWRWKLESYSKIRFIDLDKPKKVHNITNKGRFFFARLSPDKKKLVSTEYPVSGGSRLNVFNLADNSVEQRLIAPDSVQFTEPTWTKDGLFVAGLSDNGMGIYEITGQEKNGKAILRKVLSPQPVTLKNLHSWADGHSLSFTCDLSGVNELYTLDTDSGELYRRSSTRYGLDYPFLNEKGDSLFYNSVADSHDPSTYKQGSMMYATLVKDLPCEKVDYTNIHKYYVADVLSEQENALASTNQSQFDGNFDEKETTLTKYSKIRFPHIHSWAPVYFNYNNVESVSSDNYSKVASLGATVMFQNLIGSGYGFAGWALNKDDYTGKWRNSYHFQYAYSGLPPVFEISANINDSYQMKKQHIFVVDNIGSRAFYQNYFSKIPSVDVNLKVYLPINLSSGGVSRGIIPQVSLLFTNEVLKDLIIERHMAGYTSPTVVNKDGRTKYLKKALVSTRGYIIRPTAPSQIFPSLGVGVEVGYATSPGHSLTNLDAGYVYAYGYLPGIIPQHGIRLSTSYGFSIGKKDYFASPIGVINTTPRGFADSHLQDFINNAANSSFKASIDYAMPILPVDWTFLGPIAYIKNFELTPFVDFGKINLLENGFYRLNADNEKSATVASFGAEFAVKLGNYLWLPYETKFGIIYARNAWQNIKALQNVDLGKNYVGFSFTTAL